MRDPCFVSQKEHDACQPCLVTYSLYPLQYNSSIICPGALNCRAAVLLLGVVILLHIIPPCSSLLSVARSWVCLGFAAHQSSCHLGFSCRFTACHPSLLPGYWFTTSHQAWVYHRDVSLGNFALAFELRREARFRRKAAKFAIAST